LFVFQKVKGAHMKSSRKSHRSKSARRSHKSLIGILVIASVLLIGVVTALSMQGRQPQKPQAVEDIPVTKQSNRNYVTSNENGQTVVKDRQTGKVRQLTPEEASRLAEGIKQLVNQSTEGLVAISHADGSVSMDLQGRFQNVLLAKREDDGTITQTCVDNVDSAAAFFEIDPELVGAAARIAKPVSTKLEDR
jgi:hypothetical protein